MYNFRAIIIGGSVTGQTLALAFEKGNIDYVLLEARPEMAPDEGASVGMAPNGFRILDQLGLLESISARSSPLEKSNYRAQNGHSFCESNMLATLVKR
jgi:2-polyprenyl-6-methoxyphenol hydroxylase-like FAD-dependent oxidoreductase